jgi:uncharacterized sodium:solute symporter family permease YidK
MGKLNAINFSLDFNQRYTFWSGLFGGFFLALSYFGTDQSQVQRYLAGGSLVGSRFGLLVSAVVKVPMQFLILLTGVMVFVFFQFEQPPMFFNQPAYRLAAQNDQTGRLPALQTRFDAVHAQKQTDLRALTAAMASDSGAQADAARAAVLRGEAEIQKIRSEVKETLKSYNPKLETKDSDYVFITFVLEYLPHGLIGLLIAVIFCAALSSTAAELNALGSTSEVDFYRPLIRPGASERHYLIAAKILTAAWGGVAIGFALFANLVENLLEAVNILGSIFYGTILGLFLAAFFLRFVRGTAVFAAALLSQSLVLVLFYATNIGYLWYNVIGCAAVCLFSVVLEKTIFAAPATR